MRHCAIRIKPRRIVEACLDECFFHEHGLRPLLQAIDEVHRFVGREGIHPDLGRAPPLYHLGEPQAGRPGPLGGPLAGVRQGRRFVGPRPR